MNELPPSQASDRFHRSSRRLSNCAGRTALAAALVAVLGLQLSACSSPSIPIPPDAGTESPDAEAPGLDAGPATLTVRARAITDAGAIELAGDATTEVPVESRFELELGALKDVRVRLVDESDKGVPSTDRLELGANTRYSLSPDEPLIPGSGYALAIEGLRAWEPTAATGQPLPMARIAVRTAGEKPAPPASAKTSAKAKKKSKKGR